MLRRRHGLNDMWPKSIYTWWQVSLQSWFLFQNMWNIIKSQLFQLRHHRMSTRRALSGFWRNLQLTQSSGHSQKVLLPVYSTKFWPLLIRPSRPPHGRQSGLWTPGRNDSRHLDTCHPQHHHPWPKGAFNSDHINQHFQHCCHFMRIYHCHYYHHHHRKGKDSADHGLCSVCGREESHRRRLTIKWP